MPQIFDRNTRISGGPAEKIDMLRKAYVTAKAALQLTDSSWAECLTLVRIVQELSDLKNGDDIARLAIDLYRARQR